MKRTTPVILLASLAITMGLFAQDPSPVDVPEPSPTPDETAIIRIYESAPPKPIGQVPEGWELAVIRGRKIEHPAIDLPNGKKTRLTSLAYLLVPGEGRVAFNDPGFDPELGTAQKATIGAALTAYIENSQSVIKILDGAESMILEQFGETKEAAQPAEQKQPEPPKKKKP